jgi:hypothetical protein
MAEAGLSGTAKMIDSQTGNSIIPSWEDVTTISPDSSIRLLFADLSVIVTPLRIAAEIADR